LFVLEKEQNEQGLRLCLLCSFFCDTKAKSYQRQEEIYMYDVAIIGCGVVGAATAYALSRYDMKVVVLEAENDVAEGATKANSAILHAGFDPEPNTSMARLNVDGIALAKQICDRLDVPYKICGSLVLALSPEELPHLQHLYDNGIANGVPDIHLLSAEETLQREPNLSKTVQGALWAPSAGIISPWEYALAMIEVAVRNGVELRRNCPVSNIRKKDGVFSVSIPSDTVEAKYVINAAGVYSDKIHNMICKPSFHIIPTRGEYYVLDKNEGELVHSTIFQCPSKVGKGVLVSPTVDGNLIVGPNAEEVGPEDRGCTAAGLSFIAETARRSVPGFSLGDSIRNFAGVRANVDTGDFIIGEAPDVENFIDLAGIKSPGLSSSAAIALEVIKIFQKKRVLPEKKKDYKDGRKKIHFKQLSAEEKAKLVHEHPEYGRVICRCETVTEGEILNAIHSDVPARTIDGVKRRCNAGMGRCQGGFCGPRVLEILCRELHIDPLQVLQDRDGSYVLESETKQGGKHHV
jgi:glycerol-3-phosphate dehydrogenase